MNVAPISLGLSGGMIALVVVGMLLLAGVAGLLIFYATSKKVRQQVDETYIEKSAAVSTSVRNFAADIRASQRMQGSSVLLEWYIG